MRVVQNIFDKFTQVFLHHQSFMGYIEPVIQHFLPAWRDGFYRAKIHKVVKFSSAYVEITLKPEKKWPKHRAGQHIHLTIEANGRLLTRTFTITSSSDEHDLTGLIKLLVKVDERGRFTGQLFNVLNTQMWCNISKPYGEFTVKSLKKPLLMVAGGSGITPFISMLSQHLPQIKESVSLVYYAKEGEHQFIKRLNSLQIKYDNFSFNLCARKTSQSVEHYVNEHKLSDVYCCGPFKMMEEVQRVCDAAGTPYYQEVFGVSKRPLNKTESCSNKLTLKLKQSSIHIKSQGTLLEQLESHNLPVVRGCGIGICHQCQCVKNTGVVRDIRTGQLSDRGQQLIQLCVSEPVSDLDLSL
jgi:ferredoxin-NADP reductase